MKQHKEFPTFVKNNITKVQLVKYAGASGDYTPLHFTESFARESGYKDVIVYGMLTMGFMSQYAEMFLEMNQEITSIKARFKRVVYPTDTITCKAKLKEENDTSLILVISAINQNEEVVLAGEVGIRK